jgi:glycine betaine/proline transport system permease protein
MTTIAATLPRQENPTSSGRRLAFYLGALLALIIVGVAIAIAYPQTTSFPERLVWQVQAPIDELKSWVIANRATSLFFTSFIDPISDFIEAFLRSFERFLLAIPQSAMIVFVAAVAYKSAGRGVAIFSAAALFTIGLFGLWVPTMETMALMGVSVSISLAIGIPLGILCARWPRLDAFLRPILDAMQVMPAFVYLIPVVLIFGIARTPSVVATVIYALPPAVRLTCLGIRQVAPNTVEAADAFGSTSWQKLRKVQLPLAIPTILVGVNQTIMMALSIVVIAAMIGAGGLGEVVLKALQRQNVGLALEAGLAIVFLAMIFDRISGGLARESKRSLLQPTAEKKGAPPRWLMNYVFWATTLLIALMLAFLSSAFPGLAEFPSQWRVSIAAPVNDLVAWMRDNLYQIGDLPIGAGPLSDFTIIYLLNPLRSFLRDALPWFIVVLCIALIGMQAGGWRLALLCAGCTYALGGLGMWSQSMDTLSQVLVAVVITVLLGIPLGIFSARSLAFRRILRPILDFLQTIPPFVYLVPVVMLFNPGRVPGVIASVLYALPPITRLTDLGIRQAPQNAVEAAQAFGSTSRQTLFKVELPLAHPSMMMGLNQSVMMALSMVIIAGLVGGGALGLEAVMGLARGELGRGIAAGMAIVLLAIILDRITQAWARQGVAQ